MLKKLLENLLTWARLNWISRNFQFSVTKRSDGVFKQSYSIILFVVSRKKLYSEWKISIAAIDLIWFNFVQNLTD